MAGAIKLYQTGELQQAEGICRQVIRQDPENAEALNLLGVIAHQFGNHDTASELIRRAIEIKPGEANFYNNLGLVLTKQERHEDAMASYRRAIALNPNYPEAHYHLGNLLLDQGKLDAAIECYQEALRLKPDFADAHNNLGNAFIAQGKLDAAIEHYQETLRLQPGFTETHNSLGLAFMAQGKLDEAIEHYRKAMGINSEFAGAHSNLLLTLNYQHIADSVQNFAEHQRWARQHAAPLESAIQPHSNDCTPSRRLRIGYVSPDFRLHSVAFFLEPILAAHDHDSHEIFCYSDVARPDGVTERLQGLADCWRNIEGLTHEQVGDQVRKDQIDILVDLAGHTGNNRMLLFARKPAPVQVSYLGYPNTTGLSTMDYKITDYYADPEGQADTLYTEKLIRLPHCFLCYQPPLEIPEVAKLPALKTGVVTFGSFNNLSKVTPEVIALWSSILTAIPNTVIIMKFKGLADIGTRQGVLESFIKNGVSGERVILIGDMPSTDQHLTLYNNIDIGLDTFPYNGTTTTCEALWMGVPVITMAGDRHGSRMGVSLLSNVGLSDLIAESTENYVEKAVHLAGDLNRLKELRSNLRSIMSQSPLMDAKGLTNSIEEAYRNMWHRWCEQRQDRSEEKKDVPQKNNRQDLIDALESAVRHYHAGDLQQAEEVSRGVLEHEPDNTEALHILGIIALQRGNYDIAFDLVSKAVIINASNPTYHNSLGNVLKKQGRLDEAINCFQKALQLKPDFAFGYYNLGNTFKDQGRFDKAIECYQKALQLKPDFVESCNSLGCMLMNQGRFSDAIECYQKALQLKPDYVQAHSNFGNVLRGQGRLEEAAEHLQKALRLKPDYAEAYCNLGNVLQDQGKLSKAIECYQKVLQLKPGYVEAYSNLGAVLQNQGRVDEAIECYQKALQLKPDLSFAHSNLLMGLHYRDQIDPVELFSQHKRWAEQHASPFVGTIKPHINDRSPERCLRVGYVSPDFRMHSVAYFIEAVMASHDQADFETIYYSDVACPDSMTNRLKALAGCWRDIVGMSDEQVADLIRNDEIDILVDLAGHTAKNRMLLFARKPAPVQVTYLGYPDTTGLPTMDYRITDSWTDPPDQTDHLYTEELVRLAQGFLCYKPPEETPEVTKPPVLETENITFASFNNRPKITPEVVRLWSKILTLVPNAGLVLKSKPLSDPRTQELLLEMFVQNGVSPDRIRFVGYISSQFKHLELYNSIDVGLDTFPYNGTTTTCEALWMGVPVIVLAGETHASRVGVSLLTNAGLPELIAESAEEYVEKAVRLAGDLNRLKELRSNLRSIMSQSPLMDAKGLTRSMEEAYRQMWHRWCGQTPDGHLERENASLHTEEHI